MTKTEVSILLEILDLEYLKPILTDRFQKIDQLALVNLHEIGIQNTDDLSKLRHALDELQENQDCVEHYEPFLSMNDSSHMITRIENETNLVSSSLNLLLNNANNSNTVSLRDDATSDLDYSLYRSEIDQTEADVQKLQNQTQELIEQIEAQFLHQSPTKQSSNKTLIILALSAFCIGVLFYIKRK